MAEGSLTGYLAAIRGNPNHAQRQWRSCGANARAICGTPVTEGTGWVAFHPIGGSVALDEGQRAKQRAGRPPELPLGFSAVITADSETAEAARRLEYEVFVEEGFFPPSGDKRLSAYASYESRSIFHVVLDDTGMVIGVVRSLLGDYETLPVGDHAPERWEGFPSEPVCEYASLAIRPEMRKHLGIAEELYRSVFALAWRSGVSGLVALVDPWLQELLNGYYGCEFDQLGPDVDLHGFDVRPIGVPLGTLEQVMPVRVPDFWAWLVEGIEKAEIVIDLRDRIATNSGISSIG